MMMLVCRHGGGRQAEEGRQGVRQKDAEGAAMGRGQGERRRRQRGRQHAHRTPCERRGSLKEGGKQEKAASTGM